MNKAFQIYIGQPSEMELECMEKTKSLFDEYTLFSDDIEGATPLAVIEDSLKFYRFLEIYEHCTNPIQKSDILRYSYLYSNPELWYIDCDAEILELPPIEGNRPLFAEYMGKADGFIIFGNGNKEVFNLILQGIYGKIQDGRCLTLSPYQIVKKQPNTIPKMYFKHKGL